MILALLLSLTFMYTFAAGIRRLPVKQPCRERIWRTGGTKRTGESREKWETRRRESGFSGQNVTGGVTGSGKEVQVKVSGKVSVWGRQNLIFETESDRRA